MKTPKRLAIVFWIGPVLVGIAALAGSIVVVTSKSYFDSQRVRSDPVWLSELFLKARRVSGRFREPPSNEEMIRDFREHEAQFEKLVTDYYSLQQTEGTDFANVNELLK